ncbi:serine hydrolase domain-containing protein [Rufibacter glacialis]|uniref:Serine hydrolase domain-containing protein n=1 Tax=Rufibacter glacialis TaxID=1259555 RepID=A0ABV4RFM3_9BACT|nr:serine hydrolase [Rufibacter glacialis]
MLLFVLAGGMLAGCASTDCITPQASRSNTKLAPPAEPDLSGLEALADSLAHSYLVAGDLPGLSLAMAQAGEMVLSQGYGDSNGEMGIPISPHTVCKIRSLTKQFTVALLLRLAEEGQVPLEDTLTFYLQDLPAQGQEGTMRQFLNPASGLTQASSSLNRQTALARGEKQWSKLDLAYREMVKRFGTCLLPSSPARSTNTTTWNFVCWAR